jgi:hypothetical protein
VRAVVGTNTTIRSVLPPSNSILHRSLHCSSYFSHCESQCALALSYCDCCLSQYYYNTVTRGIIIKDMSLNIDGAYYSEGSPLFRDRDDNSKERLPHNEQHVMIGRNTELCRRFIHTKSKVQWCLSIAMFLSVASIVTAVWYRPTSDEYELAEFASLTKRGKLNLSTAHRIIRTTKVSKCTSPPYGTSTEASSRKVSIHWPFPNSLEIIPSVGHAPVHVG